MNRHNYSSVISITINGQVAGVYKNQTVLQSLLQVDECYKYSCFDAKYNNEHYGCSDCTVKVENYNRNHIFKACLAPVEPGMKIMTKPLHYYP